MHRHPRRQNRRRIAHHRLPRIAAVPADAKGALSSYSGVESIAARAVAHTAEKRVLIAGMVQQHPRHPRIFFRQTPGRGAPIFPALVARQDVTLGIHFLPRPHARRTPATTENHPRSVSRQEVPLVGVTMQFGIGPWHAVLHAVPLLSGIIAAEKTSRRRNIVTFFAAWVVPDVMHVDIVDARAAIFPGLAAIAAQQYSAMFQQNKQQVLIIRMNKNMPHMWLFNTAQSGRHIPFLRYLFREVEHAVQRLPLRPAVLTAKQTNRTDAHVNDPFVMEVHGEGPHISFHDLLPRFASVPCPITSVKGDRGEYDFRLFVATDQMLKRFALEELATGVQRSALSLHDFETPVVRDVIA